MIKSIKKWFEIAVPEPTEQNQSVQLGCHAEETVELLEAVGIFPAELWELSHELKNQECTLKIDREALLDALCDQIVTAVGVAHMFGMDIESALKEVNDSNYSKFESGKPVFNEQGKIAKGENYFAPNLEKFI